MMKKGRQSMSILKILILGFGVVFGGNVYAAAICDELVYDESGVLGKDLVKVESAAKLVAETGAMIRVRIFRNLGGANDFAKFQRNMEMKCATWRRENDFRKASLIVLYGFTEGKRTAFYYGMQWKPALDAHWQTLKTNYMNPPIADGNWSLGMIRALEETKRRLEFQINPPAQAATPPPAVIIDRQPADYSGLWTVMGWGLGLVALIIIGFVIVKFLDFSGRKREARQAADLAEKSASLKIASLDEELLTTKAKLEELSVAGFSTGKFSETIDTVSHQRDSIKEEMRANKLAIADADKKGLSELEYRANAGIYQKVADEAQRSKNKLAELSAAINRLKNISTEIPNMIDTLSARICLAKERHTAGKESFSRMAKSHAPSSWASVRGNGTEAANRIDWAEKAVFAAKAFSSPEKREWEHADKSVTEGNTWLGEAESLIGSILEREKNLERAKVDAPKEIDAALADVKKAQEYIFRNATGLNRTHNRNLEKANRLIREAGDNLKKPQPDYPEVLKSIKEAHDLADSVLKQARSEQEELERLTKKEASLKRDVERAISKAKEFFADHKPRISSEAKELLAAAEKLHNSAGKKSNSLKDRVNFLEEAQKEANSAYDKASQAVRAANKERGKSWGNSASQPTSHSDSSTFIFVGGGSSPSPSVSSNSQSVTSCGGGGGNSGSTSSGCGGGGGGGGCGGGG